MPNMPAFDPALVFSLANALAGVSWIALAASLAGARWAPRTRFVAGRVVPLIFAAVYVLLFASTGLQGGGYDSLAAVQRLMAVPALLTAGWLHYLAFDLFVGAWIAERSAALGIPHLIVLPLLGLTFLFGPAGLLAFAAMRIVCLRRRSGTVGA